MAPWGGGSCSGPPLRSCGMDRREAWQLQDRRQSRLSLAAKTKESVCYLPQAPFQWRKPPWRRAPELPGLRPPRAQREDCSPSPAASLVAVWRGTEGCGPGGVSSASFGRRRGQKGAAATLMMDGPARRASPFPRLRLPGEANKQTRPASRQPRPLGINYLAPHFVLCFKPPLPALKRGGQARAAQRSAGDPSACPLLFSGGLYGRPSWGWCRQAEALGRRASPAGLFTGGAPWAVAQRKRPPLWKRRPGHGAQWRSASKAPPSWSAGKLLQEDKARPPTGLLPGPASGHRQTGGGGAAAAGGGLSHSAAAEAGGAARAAAAALEALAPGVSMATSCMWEGQLWGCPREKGAPGRSFITVTRIMILSAAFYWWG